MGAGIEVKLMLWKSEVDRGVNNVHIQVVDHPSPVQFQHFVGRFYADIFNDTHPNCYILTVGLDDIWLTRGDGPCIIS
jgi:hypothetical protein